MKFLCLVLFAFFVCSCTSPAPAPVCAVQATVAGALSSSIGGALVCTNTAQIKADMSAALDKVSMCPSASAMKAAAKPQGVVGGIVCPLAVNAALGLVSSQIPASWGCAPGATTASLSAVLSAACIAVVPI